MKQETHTFLRMIFYLMIFLVLTIVVVFICFIVLNESKSEGGYACKYYDNETCYCGDYDKNGVFEYMHFGKLIKTDYGDFCCVATHNLCGKLN